VRREVDRVATAGFKEIALTGVHLGCYGRDLDPPSSLVDLLDALSNSLKPELLFRISSLEPMDCSRELLDRVVGSGCFAPHLHLPLQHVSNRLLATMRRPYTIEYYSALVSEIRARMPNASIGSDVIVGFPGETDQEFEALVSYLESAPLTHVHVFPYSDRPGTEASMMPGKVAGASVRERARRVREISHKLTRQFRESQVGLVHRGLTLEDGTLVVTGNYLKVRIPPGHVRNDWVNVRVTSAEDTLKGEPY
jgi:threonylcarbamoyladenosine tRNA methylthiotransferase MtaB